MTNEGSPGAPHLSYSNPTSGIMPRRSSYASVAAGTAGVSSNSGHLSRIVNTSPYNHSTSLDQPSRIPQPISDSDTRVEGGMDIPSSRGRGGSFSSPRFPSQSYGGSAGSGAMLGFFAPSYLKGSKHMEKLEAAHKAKLAAQADELLTRSSKPGSLSTSSSSVSLHKMAPSHRGMTYEIIERQPEVEDDGLTPLPSKWAETDKNAALEISADGQDVKFVGPSKTLDHEAASTRSDNPMPPQCGIYYYEVNIISKGKEGMIGVGFSGASASLEKLPGWEPESWAYHGDDGKSFCASTPGKPYGPTFTSGDVIGCGVNFMKGCAFFTKNGVFQENAFRDLRDLKVYPSVGMKRPHAHLSVNFGQRPFMFDIDRMVSRERQSIIDEINAADVSNLHPTLNKDELCKALVAQYLSHDGYVETARAFASEVRAEATALRGIPESKLEGYLSVEDDHDAMNRQQIRTAILDGDIDKAIKLTNAFYPHVLQDNPQIYFKLRCRKFIEMMRQSTDFLDNSTSKPTKSSTTNGHSTAGSDDGFEPDMDLDEPITSKDGGHHNNDDWDRMDTEDGVGGDNWGLKYQTLLGVIIRYGQELKHEFKDDQSKHVTDTFADIFSMFPYPDPRKSPQGKLLESEQRVPVAEGLNSAILVSLGKSSSTALERLYKQSVVLVDMISEDGGPGSFINDIFLYGIIVPVIPFALTNRVGVAEADVQHWVSVLLAVYGAALLVASPICGYLADNTPSRRLPLLIGLLALLGSTLLLCLGTTLALLIIGRLLQGFSAAIVWTVGLALLADTVGHDTIGQAMGYVSMSMSVAVLVAPLLGGVVYARAGYYSVFFMAFGLTVLDIILRVVLVEKKIAKQWMPTEPGTSLPSPLPSPSPTPAEKAKKPPLTKDQPEHPRSTPLPPEASAPPLTIFPIKHQLPPIFTLLASRRLLAALFCTLIQSTLLTAWDAVLPLYVHRLFGWGSTGGGLIFLPLILPSFAAPLIGYWSDRRGPRVPTTSGFLLAVPFLVAMRAVDRGGVGQMVLLCALLACLGVALSMAMTPLLAEITYIINVKEKSHPGVFGRRGAYATAYGLFNTAFAGGMLVGPIWGGFVTQGSGWGTTGWTLAVLALVGAGVAALLIGGWVGRVRVGDSQVVLEIIGDGREQEGEV